MYVHVFVFVNIHTCMLNLLCVYVCVLTYVAYYANVTVGTQGGDGVKVSIGSRYMNRKYVRPLAVNVQLYQGSVLGCVCV